MVFSSHIFLLVFLPIVLSGFYALKALGGQASPRRWLLLASLVFYGWWSWTYLGVLVATILANYGIGRAIMARRNTPLATTLMWLGIVANLGLLGYFKYAHFFADNINSLLGTHWALEAIVLPLAISFHTFQQIAYLVETRNGLDEEISLERYLLFVTFFPQLIAGPIVRHIEIAPQIRRLGLERRDWMGDISIGLTFLIIGLAKKTLLADPLAPIVNEAFASAQAGSISTPQAWQGMLAYTLQLYFDFSGYSDMAVGLARMFGLRLPVNFWSPYQARDIAEFWRRWHITLSRFLRDYLYIPLGGNRRGPARTYANLLVTMLLGGLWHGAAWTFLLWGAYHGCLLALHRLYRQYFASNGERGGRSTRGLAIGVTFLFVALGWVIFRAPDLQTALNLFAALPALNTAGGTVNPWSWAHILLLLGLVFLMPNSWQIMADARQAPPGGEPDDRAPLIPLRWRPVPAWGLFLGVLGAAAILATHRYTEFLYFQF